MFSCCRRQSPLQGRPPLAGAHATTRKRPAAALAVGVEAAAAAAAAEEAVRSLAVLFSFCKIIHLFLIVVSLFFCGFGFLFVFWCLLLTDQGPAGVCLSLSKL